MPVPDQDEGSRISPLGRHAAEARENSLWRLKRVPLFASFDAPTLEALAAEARQKFTQKGEIVVAQGQPAAGVFIVLDGTLKVSVVGGNGQEVGLSIIGANEVFGEMAAVDNHPHSATVTTLVPCDLRVVPPSRFAAFLEAHPKAALPLLKVAVQRLRFLTARSEAMGSELPARLAKILLLLSGRFGVTAESGVRIDLEMTQKTLGELAGASRESINKQFRLWEAAGIVARIDREIMILQMSTLREISEDCAAPASI